MQKELSTTKGTPVNEIVADTVRDDLDKFKIKAFKTPLSKYSTEYPHIQQCILLKRFLNLMNKRMRIKSINSSTNA